ncbi:MAG: hypothetical protein K2L71_09205 [Muribaculaceae bacterium]|nr:hypothetical protein [Muribaculaceae bacterium]
MLRNLLSICIFLIAASAVCLAAEKSDGLKPRWMVSSVPSAKSPGYVFVSAQGRGATLDEARQRALVNLTAKLEHERGLEITSTVSVDKTASRASGGSRSSTTSQSYSMQCTERGKQITLTTRVVDEYWERANGIYTVTQLYTVNDQNAAGGSYADRITLTSRYGGGPVFMSLIPGAGQFYKGSNVKGGLIMGGAVVCGAGIVAAEALRSSYANKCIEYPRDFDFYNKRSTDWRNVRNVCIGVGVALYVYNLIDAAVAPGRRQVKVSRGKIASFSLAPVPMSDPCGTPGAGLAFSIGF